MVEFVDPALIKTPLSPGKSRRVLTTTEKALFDKLGSKQWIANCQPTPPEYDGPERVINYLSYYVQGNVISAGSHHRSEPSALAAGFEVFVVQG